MVPLLNLTNILLPSVIAEGLLPVPWHACRESVCQAQPAIAVFPFQSKHSTPSSASAPSPIADVRIILSPHTIGVEPPFPGSSAFQRTPSVSEKLLPDSFPFLQFRCHPDHATVASFEPERLRPSASGQIIQARCVWCYPSFLYVLLFYNSYLFPIELSITAQNSKINHIPCSAPCAFFPTPLTPYRIPFFLPCAGRKPLFHIPHTSHLTPFFCPEPFPSHPMPLTAYLRPAPAEGRLTAAAFPLCFFERFSPF
jgi:hypothetical protein